MGSGRINRLKIEARQELPPRPDGWSDQADECEDFIQKAYDDAKIPRLDRSLITKTINGRDYYRLQWRESDTVTS